MRSKILRGAGFWLLAAALFLLCNYRYAHSEYYRSMAALFRYEAVPEDLQIVNFGSSHETMDIDYSVLPEYRCFNFALHGQSLRFDRALMKSYADNLGEGCVVILPASYFTLYYDPYRRFTSDYSRYCRVLSLDGIKEAMPDCGFKELALYRWFPLLSSQKNFVKILEPLPSEPLTYEESDRVIKADKIEENAKVRSEYHLGRVTEEPNRVCVSAYREMLDLCRERGWKPVVMTGPVYSSYKKGFSEALERIEGQMDELLADYPEVVRLDYSGDPRFCDSPDLYYDSNHLSKNGREMFTKILYEDLVDHGLLAAG